MTTTDHHAALVQAATIAGLSAVTRSKGYEEHDPDRRPVDITDLATGRAIVATCNRYPDRGRWTFYPQFPKDSTGQDCGPRDMPPVPTAAKDTPPERMARRLRKYFHDFAPAFQAAETRRDERNAYHAKTAATVATLIDAGALPPGPHDRGPFKLPPLASGAYSRENRAGADSVTMHLEGLSTAQACAVIRALLATD